MGPIYSHSAISGPAKRIYYATVIWGSSQQLLIDWKIGWLTIFLFRSIASCGILENANAWPNNVHEIKLLPLFSFGHILNLEVGGSIRTSLFLDERKRGGFRAFSTYHLGYPASIEPIFCIIYIILYGCRVRMDYIHESKIFQRTSERSERAS